MAFDLYVYGFMGWTCNKKMARAPEGLDSDLRSELGLESNLPADLVIQRCMISLQNTKTSPERAKYHSPGQRPGWE